MKLWLVAAGYEVDLASDGREALERVKAEPPDLVLLDLMMPDVTGYVVCRQMREFEKTKRTPIIVITALPTAADSNEARMSGADEVMVKPVEEMQVLQKIRHYLGASVFK
jgi:two-component system cell cycle response regulator